MVSQYIAKAKNQRRQMEIEREKRQSESAAQRIQASGTSFAARMAEIAIRNPEIFDTLTPEEQEEAKQTILRGAGVGKQPEKKASVVDLLD